MTTTPLRILAIIATISLVVGAAFAIFLSIGVNVETTRLQLFGFVASFVFAISLSVIGFFFLVTGLVSLIANAFAMTLHVNATFDNAPWWLRFNRFNLIARPSYLTETGLDTRRKVGIALVRIMFGFALCVPAIIFQQLAF